MSLVKGDPYTDDFFEINSIRRTSVIKDLLSKGRKHASKVMWTAWMVLSPEGPYFGEDSEEAFKKVVEDYWEGQDINIQEDYKEVLESFPDLTMDKDERDYVYWMEIYKDFRKKAMEGDFKTKATAFSKLDSAKQALKKLEEDYLKNKEKKSSYYGSMDAGLFG